MSLLMTLLANGVCGQEPNLPPNPQPRSGDSRDQDIHLPDEMRSRMEIERAEHDYQKFLEDVNKLNDLASEVAKSYQEHNRLSAEELKKVGLIEKLAKKVLNRAGGDEVGGASKPGQLTMADAVAQLSTDAATIKKNITTETRYVVSATVVANSNEVISLAQFIKRNQKAE